VEDLPFPVKLEAALALLVPHVFAREALVDTWPWVESVAVVTQQVV